MYVRLHHHGEQGPVDDPTAPFQQQRQEGPVRGLGVFQLEIPGGRGQQPGAVRVALGAPGVGSVLRASADADRRSRFRFDQLVADLLQDRADRVGRFPGSAHGKQLGQVRIGEGHRRVLVCVSRQGTRRDSRRWHTSCGPSTPTSITSRAVNARRDERLESAHATGIVGHVRPRLQREQMGAIAPWHERRPAARRSGWVVSSTSDTWGGP